MLHYGHVAVQYSADAEKNLSIDSICCTVDKILLRNNPPCGFGLSPRSRDQPMRGFIAQLVEHRTGIAEVTGSNPVEALIFFRLLFCNCLNWKFTAKITYHLHIYPQFIYESFHIHYIITEFVLHNYLQELGVARVLAKTNTEEKHGDLAFDKTSSSSVWGSC